MTLPACLPAPLPPLPQVASTDPSYYKPNLVVTVCSDCSGPGSGRRRLAQASGPRTLQLAWSVPTASLGNIQRFEVQRITVSGGGQLWAGKPLALEAYATGEEGTVTQFEADTGLPVAAGKTYTVELVSVRYSPAAPSPVAVASVTA